jgi:hypothetical protein
MAESFNRVSTQLTTTSTTDVYSAPAGNAADRAVVLGCVAANIDGVNAVDVSIDITTSEGTKLSSLGRTIAVPAGSNIDFIANKLILKQGEKLRATASAANGIDITVSALEITA